MTWRARQVAGDDTASTSINDSEGRGGGRAEERAAQMRQGGYVPFWEGARNGISRGCGSAEAVALVVPKTGRAVVVRVDAYLM